MGEWTRMRRSVWQRTIISFFVWIYSRNNRYDFFVKINPIWRCMLERKPDTFLYNAILWEILQTEPSTKGVHICRRTPVDLYPTLKSRKLRSINYLHKFCLLPKASFIAKHFFCSRRERPSIHFFSPFFSYLASHFSRLQCNRTGRKERQFFEAESRYRSTVENEARRQKISFERLPRSD